jgi:protein-S-isoprenylcysteine O-methyltransferase Ste14
MPKNQLRGLLTYQLGASLNFSIGLPIGISWLSTRHGWSGHRPGIVNLLGFLAVMAGFAIVTWANVEHVRSAHHHGWHSEMIRFEASQYLIESSRIATHAIRFICRISWSGGDGRFFFGSVAVAIGAAIVWASIAMVILPYEQRRLAQKFGAAYAAYCSRASRWIGLPAQD